MTKKIAGSKRLAEAEACLYQALRLGLSTPTLLRELATSFMASDRLTVAEDLIRRAIAAEGTAVGASAGSRSAYHRKLLGDVLAGQQQASAAVDEYKRVLASSGSEEAAADVKVSAAERCMALLQTLGRSEEAAAVRDILDVLRSASATAVAQ